MTEVEEEKEVERNMKAKEAMKDPQSRPQDEFSEDVERLKKMKKQSQEQLREVKRAKKELEESITRIDAQLDYIEYRRNGGNEIETGEVELDD